MRALLSGIFVLLFLADTNAAKVPVPLVGNYDGTYPEVGLAERIELDSIRIGINGRVVFRYHIVNHSSNPDESQTYTGGALGHLTKARFVHRGGRTYVVAKLRAYQTTGPLTFRAHIEARVRDGAIRGIGGGIFKGQSRVSSFYAVPRRS